MMQVYSELSMNFELLYFLIPHILPFNSQLISKLSGGQFDQNGVKIDFDTQVIDSEFC